MAGSRIEREKKTVQAMIRLYCELQHGTAQGFCPTCQELLRYAMARLDRCPFGEGKTTCLRCPVHCYHRTMRERVRQVMRFSGPRMPLRHPILTVRHYLDGRRRAPVRATKEGGATGRITAREEADPSGS